MATNIGNVRKQLRFLNSGEKIWENLHREGETNCNRLSVAVSTIELGSLEKSIVGEIVTPIPQPSRISVSSSTFPKARSQPTLPAGRTCDGLKADGNYGGGSAAGNPFPDVPRDPTSPEIKVPSYWLKGVVKFTDTAMRRDRARPLDARVPHGPVPFFRSEGETERW